MRTQRRRRRRRGWPLLGVACVLIVVLYFGSYGALRVHNHQAREGDATEYRYGTTRLANQKQWRSFFNLAHRVELAMWSEDWDGTSEVDDGELMDDPSIPLHAVGTGGMSSMRMFSDSGAAATMSSSDSRLLIPSFFKDSVLPATDLRQ